MKARTMHRTPRARAPRRASAIRHGFAVAHAGDLPYAKKPHVREALPEPSGTGCGSIAASRDVLQTYVAGRRGRHAPVSARAIVDAGRGTHAG